MNKYRNAKLAAKWLSELAVKSGVTIVTATQQPGSGRPIRDPSIPNVIHIDYMSLLK